MMNDSQNVFAEAGNSANYKNSLISSDIPQKLLLTTDKETCFSNLVDNTLTKFENLSFNQNEVPFLTHSRNVQASDAIPLSKDRINTDVAFNRNNSLLHTVQKFASAAGLVVNDVSSRGKNSGEKKVSSKELPEYTPWSTGFLISKEIEDLNKDRSKEHKNLQNDQTERRGKDIAEKSLAISNEINSNGKISNFADNSALDDISLEYRKLYSDLPPENHDFAMNIMAYIELLNDCSWKETSSYFDKSIKRIIRYLWNVSNYDSKWKSLLKANHRKMFLDWMVESTELCLSNRYDLGEFLKYCVEMCQVGVIGRKRHFKEAPLRVIGFLRSSTKRLVSKNSLRERFDIIVMVYAKDLEKRDMFPFMPDAIQETSDDSGVFRRVREDCPASGTFRYVPQVHIPIPMSIGNMASGSVNQFYLSSQIPFMTAAQTFSIYKVPQIPHRL